MGGRESQSLLARLRNRWPDWAAPTLAVLLGGLVLSWRNSAWQRAGGLDLELRNRAGQVRTERTPTAWLRKADRELSRAHWRGWIWVPRSGKWVFGVAALGRVQVDLDGRRVLEARLGSRRLGGHMGGLNRDWRIAKAQARLERGWHRLSVACGPETGGGCRLIWQPPGRRGDPEYVDPSFLRPGDSRPPGVGPSGPPRRDALAASLLLGLLALCCLVWFRRGLGRWAAGLREDTQLRRDFLVSLGVVALGLAVRAWLLGRTTQTWDEDVYFGAGRNYWQNLLALDFAPASWIYNAEHPPVTKYLVGFGALWTEGFLGPRVVMAVLSSLALGIGYALGRRLVGRLAAAVGMAAAALDPHLVAHGLIAGHEAPTVFFVTAALWAAGRALEQEEASGAASWHLLAGLLGGLAVAVRWPNAVVLAVWLAWWAVWARRVRRGLLQVPWGLPVGLLLAALVPLAVWPRLWHAPLYRIGQVLTYYTPWTRPVEPFLGRVRVAPWYYFFAYSGATLPSAVLLGVAGWAGLALWRRNRRRVALAIWVLLPLFGASVSPLRQDGVRYVLASFLPLYLMYGDAVRFGLDALGRRLGRAGSRMQGIGRMVVGAIAVVPVAWACWWTAPYGLDYYNFVSGGCRAAAAGRFEWSWWGEGLTACVDWLNEHGEPGRKVAVQAAARHMADLRPDLEVVGSPAGADYVVQTDDAVRRPVPRGFRVVHEERAGPCVVARVLAREVRQ